MKRWTGWFSSALFLLPMLGMLVPVALADDGVSNEMFAVNNVWMMVSAALVFFMNLGFAMVESGLTRSKNTANILFKNTLVPAIGVLTYALMGFNLMYPGTFSLGGFFGFAGFGLNAGETGGTSAYNVGYTYWTDFLFQAMFCATAATIVSGAVAERVKLSSFLIFTAVFTALVYPVIGSWKWGKGWLDALGFYDFAGSTLVHSVGGWGALAGILLLGPRIGKYVNGQIRPIMGHSMPLATLGVFILWLGWFGFNGGSVLSADPALVSYVLVTTTLAAVTGIVTSMMTSWIVQKKPDLSMVLNGCLGGLVGITAGCDSVSITSSIIIGGVAGILAVLGVLVFDKLKLDDPVGALSVHLVNGVWGTLAVGIFSMNPAHTFMAQLTGVVACGVAAFIGSFIIFLVLKLTLGIRVSEHEEMRGLDVGEHGMEAYAGFQTFVTQ